MASASSLDISAYNYAYTRHRLTWQYNWSTRKYDFLSDALFATYTGSAQTFRKERTWTRTDNYRTLKAAGVRLPDNDFTYTESKSSTMSGQCHGPFAYADWKQYQTQYRFPSFTHNVAVDPTARVDANKVYAKLVARAKGAQFNTPVFLAESRQTASMVVQRANTLVYGIRALRRGNVDGFLDSMHRSFTPPRRKVTQWKQHLVSTKRSSKGIADVWLEARYGWLPFLSEVYSAGQLLNELAEVKENLYSRVSARAQTEWKTSGDVSLINLGADGGLRMLATDTHREEVKAVWVFMPAELDGLGRLGMTNPYEVVWELVPFSFVADWFLPIGNYLSYLDLDSRFKHVGGTVGRRKEIQRKLTNPRTTFTSGGAGSAIVGFGSGTSSAVTIVRSKLLSAPIPSLESFAFNPNLNVKRVMDSISLLRQFFK